jgi:hypothetical protein
LVPESARGAVGPLCPSVAGNSDSPGHIIVWWKIACSRHSARVWLPRDGPLSPPGLNLSLRGQYLFPLWRWRNGLCFHSTIQFTPPPTKTTTSCQLAPLTWCRFRETCRSQRWLNHAIPGGVCSPSLVRREPPYSDINRLFGYKVGNAAVFMKPPAACRRYPI